MKEKKLAANIEVDSFESMVKKAEALPIGLVDIHSDELVVDMGAGIGSFYKAWQSRFTKWIAVEPSVYNCEQYKTNTGRGVEVQSSPSFDEFFGTEKKGEVGLLKIDCGEEEFKFLYKKDLSHIKYIVGEFKSVLFQTDDSGVELLDWISETHEELYSKGDGINDGYVKLFKRK
jgi:hypothetical protein